MAGLIGGGSTHADDASLGSGEADTDDRGEERVVTGDADADDVRESRERRLAFGTSGTLSWSTVSDTWLDLKVADMISFFASSKAASKFMTVAGVVATAAWLLFDSAVGVGLTLAGTDVAEPVSVLPHAAASTVGSCDGRVVGSDGGLGTAPSVDALLLPSSTSPVGTLDVSLGDVVSVGGVGGALSSPLFFGESGMMIDASVLCGTKVPNNTSTPSVALASGDDCTCCETGASTDARGVGPLCPLTADAVTEGATDCCRSSVGVCCCTTGCGGRWR